MSNTAIPNIVGGEPSFWKHALSLDDNRLREIYLEFVVKVVANPTEVTQVDLRI